MHRELSNEDNSTLRLLGKVTIYSYLSIVIIMLIVSLLTRNRGNCSYSIWQNISYIQLIHWIALIDIDGISEFESFFEEISLVFRPNLLENICEDEQINVQTYISMRINSINFINNAKEVLILWAIILLPCIVILIISTVNNSSFVTNAKSKIKYSIIIRIHLILFLEFMTYSIINIYYFTGKNTCATANLGLSIFILIIGGVWTLFIPLILKLKLNKNIGIQLNIILQSIETLIEEFKSVTRVLNYQYYTIYLLYRFSLAFSLVFLSRLPHMQLLIIAAFQFIICNYHIVVYIICIKPYKKRKDAITVFLAELFSLLVIIFIGIGTLNNLDINNKYYLALSCAITIWIIEIIIIIRFCLNLFDNSSSVQITNSIQNSTIIHQDTIISENRDIKKMAKIEEEDAYSIQYYSHNYKETNERVPNSNFVDKIENNNDRFQLKDGLNVLSYKDGPIHANISNNKAAGFDLNKYTVKNKVVKLNYVEPISQIKNSSVDPKKADASLQLNSRPSENKQK